MMGRPAGPRAPAPRSRRRPCRGACWRHGCCAVHNRTQLFAGPHGRRSGDVTWAGCQPWSRQCRDHGVLAVYLFGSPYQTGCGPCRRSPRSADRSGCRRRCFLVVTPMCRASRLSRWPSRRVRAIANRLGACCSAWTPFSSSRPSMASAYSPRTWTRADLLRIGVDAEGRGVAAHPARDRTRSFRSVDIMTAGRVNLRSWLTGWAECRCHEDLPRPPSSVE